MGGAHGGSGDAAASAASAAGAAPCSVAACLFGSARGSVGAIYDAFSRHVVGANPQCRFEFFLHSWESARSTELEALFRPQATAYGAVTHSNASHSHEHGHEHSHDHSHKLGRDRREQTHEHLRLIGSIEAVLSLRQRDEVKRRVRYSWVMLARLDALWLAPLELSSLNPVLLYVANWCVGKSKGGACRQLSKLDEAGVPDIYFAAAPEMIDGVFGRVASGDREGRSGGDGGVHNMRRSMRASAVGSGMEPGASQLIGARLQQMGIAQRRLGRAMYHQLDLAVLHGTSGGGGAFAGWGAISEGGRFESYERTFPCRAPSQAAEVIQAAGVSSARALATAAHSGGANHTNGGFILDASGGRSVPRGTRSAWRDTHGTLQSWPGRAQLWRPSPGSRCPSAIQFCLCSPMDWSPNLVERARVGSAPVHREWPRGDGGIRHRVEHSSQAVQCSPHSAPWLTTFVALWAFLATLLIAVCFSLDPRRSHIGSALF